MMKHHSNYYDAEHIAARVAAGAHRDVVGGLWDELGSLQLDYLRAIGMTPESSLLDIGCGSLRLGARAAAYLESGKYWGTDMNESLLDAGYKHEIVEAGLAAKLPRTNLVVDGDFTFEGLPRDFAFVMAQSVFTHLPFNHLRLCLTNLAAHIAGPCTFCLTLFLAPDDSGARPVKQTPGGATTYPHRDPYHYVARDIQHAIVGLPWTIEYVGAWRHPRNQKMVRLKVGG